MDLVAFDDLDLFANEITDPLASLEQDLYHRLIEPSGSNIDDLNRGLGIEEALSGTLDTSLPGRIEAEFRKDARVISARATVTELTSTSNAGATMRIEIEVVADEGELNMDLTLDKSGLSRTT